MEYAALNFKALLRQTYHSNSSWYLSDSLVGEGLRGCSSQYVKLSFIGYPQGAEMVYFVDTTKFKRSVQPNLPLTTVGTFGTCRSRI